MTKLFNIDEYSNKLGANLSGVLKATNDFAIPNAGLVKTVDTITDIISGVVEAKYYELGGQTPSDFVSIDVGRGAYMGNIVQFTSAYVGSPFEQCIINPASTGIHNDATADIVIDDISIKNNFYRQKYSISQEELKMASANRVAFDIIEQKEKSRKKTWDLGIQNVLFNGLADGQTKGLLNQTGVTVNTTLLPVAIETMSEAQLKTLAGRLISTYFTNANGAVMPNRWLMPTNTFMALGVPYGSTFGMPTIKDVLETALKASGAPADFKIVHALYANGASADGNGRHALYNTEDVVMYIPKAYTPHPLYAQGALDMISDAEGQFTGVQVKRPGAFMYLDEQA